MAGRKTHGAGFTGGINHGAAQVDSFEFAAGLTESMNFSVSGDIGRLPDNIVSRRNNFSVPDNAGAEGCLAFCDSEAGDPDCSDHGP